MAKTGKVVQLFQKPENFIRSRARQLRLGKCYITANWEDSNIANVIVSRCHINGNLTLGIYLIDLSCLGIKDSTFKFNIPPDELDDLVELIGGEEIEYNKVHNIIYGAASFAESCGFKPHKDWSIGQYILEEDDDQIPLIDIPFGENGVPAYYVGPSDHAASINRILATLDKYVGPGNYYFFPDDEPEDLFEEFNPDYNRGNDASIDLIETYYDLTNEYKRANQVKQEFVLNEDHISEILETIVVDNTYCLEDHLEEKIWKCTADNEEVFEEKSLENIEKIKKLIIEDSSNPYLYTELFLQYKELGLHEKADKIAKRGIELFPDFLYLRLFVAHVAMIDEELEKGFELLNNKYYPDEAFPYRDNLTDGEFMFFYCALCQYFLAKNDIMNAIYCGDVLINDIYDYSSNEDAIIKIFLALKPGKHLQS